MSKIDSTYETPPAECERDRLKAWWDNNYRHRHDQGPQAPSDSKGYVRGDAEVNIFGGIHPDVRNMFRSGTGNELEQKMRALHSSSALGLNVFGHWLGSADRTPLQRALGLTTPIIGITFEEKFPTGVRGYAPNLDVALWLADGHICAIESKYLEPFNTHERGLKDGYFKPRKRDTRPRWDAANLPRHQTLADQLRDGTVDRFCYLHAEQLLKHSLGLANRDPKRAKKRSGAEYWSTELIYLYFNPDSPEATLHADEVADYSRAIGGADEAVHFRGVTYQDLHKALCAECAGLDCHNAYISYLGDRYFPSTQD